ncbi:MAG: S8 family peptidase [Longimicrobiaceae bacterium]
MRTFRFLPAASLLLALALAACSDRSTTPVGPDATGQPDLSAAITQAEIPSRQEERPGTFLDLSDEELWQALLVSDGVAAVGLKAPGTKRGVYRGQILMARGQSAQARRALLARHGIELLKVDELLPLIEVRFTSAAALTAVRRLPIVDYIEPVMVEQDQPQWAATGGCGYGGSWTGDRQSLSGDVYSARFTAMRIPAAWRLSNGAGITIGLTDTGISSTQAQLGSQFASGESGGRTIRLFRLSSQSSVYDQCGHGTRMAGVLAAPNDGQSVVGVAWKSNLISVRQASGVAAVSSSDARASVRGAAQNGSQIIVMAWQSLNWFWQVSDEIKYWHYNRPILFVGTAGTSGCGDGILDSNVVFPAQMSEVVAVTGISYPNGGMPCGIHYGKQVELTAYLDVPTTGQYTADVVGIGGSSNATAIVAGVAALVWSRTPALTRDQVRARLQQSGGYYPNRHSREGFGLVDAYKAVSGR